MKKRYLLLLIPCCVAFLVLAAHLGTIAGKAIFQARYFVSLPQYEENVTAQTSCPLCDRAEVECPCLVDLNTGAVYTIQLYDYVDGDLMHIDTQRTEYGIARSGGFPKLGSYYSFPDEHYVMITLYRDSLYRYSETNAQKLFCKSCMDKIAQAGTNCGILIADCSDQENLALYGLEAAADGIRLRHYTITIEDKNTVRLSLRMTSSFFGDDRSEMDHDS